MNTKFSRPDKSKGKFAQSTINLFYKGNASEIQSKPTIRSSGYQVVGKLQGTRRNPPPPPWVPSIKAEMGGQDTKVNIVPPGGSGWGTGSLTASAESDSKEKVETSSILKDITEAPHNESAEAKGTVDASQTPLVNPPQKSFFELRPKSTIVKPPEDISPDISRPLSSKVLAPMVPFYQRPFAAISSSAKETETTDSSTEESREEPQSASKSMSASCSGWAAVTTEEPDFQERINFSGDEEEPSKKSNVEAPNDPIKTHSVSETSWVSTSVQSQAPSSKVSYPRAAWEQSPCFSSVSPMQQAYNPPYCGRSDGLFAESSLAGSHSELLVTRGVSLLSEQLQRTSFNSSEAQVQAQREERTLAYKSAVTRAQMARKKRSDEIVEPKRKDQSIESVKNALTDVSVFPQSFMQSGPAAMPGPSPFPIPAAVNHSPQHSVEPVFAALYSGALPNMLHTVTPGNGFMPSQMKPQGHVPSPLSSSTWNPGSFSTTNQSPFMHPSYPLSNSPKLATNQGSYFKSDPFSMNTFTPQPTSKSNSHVQSLQPEHSVDNVVHSFANPMGETSMVNHLPFPPAKPHLAHQQSNSPILEKRMENEASRELLNSLSRGVAMNSHPLQISAHADGTRTAFTPPTVPSTIESYPSAQNPQQSSTIAQQQVQPTSHITPLMEVDLSGKWSEKDFEVFQNSLPSRGNYIKSFKSGRGGSKHLHEDRSVGHRYGFANSGRPNRGAPCDATKRPIRRPTEGPEDRTDDNQPATKSGTGDTSVTPQQGDTKRQCKEEGGSGTFPRQQRSRGVNRVSRSNRRVPQDCYEDKQNGDFEVHHKTSIFGRGDKWKSGYKSSRRGEAGAEKANSITSAGSGRGRKNFSRSGANNRRFGDGDGASKPRGHFANQPRHDETTATQGVLDNMDPSPPSDSEQGTLPLHPEDVNCQVYHSQRSSRGGGNAGRGRRGQHSGSQRQPQRRDRTDRANNRRPNPRRHPDDDDDHDFNGAPSANNNGTSNTTVAADSSSNANTSKGEGGGSTNESSGQHHQQGGAVDSALSCGTGTSVLTGTKPRSHAHSVTLASDVEVWETASEGFSSSLVGTSPGCSFAECANSSIPVATMARTDDDDDDIDDAGGYVHPPKKLLQRRSMVPITGKIVPLMSINAEAPPSFCDNPSFLDSPPPLPPPPLQEQQPKSDDFAPGTALVESKDIESIVGSTTTSSEDGFQEVRSKSAKKQHKAKQLQKSQKSPASSDERSSIAKSGNRDATGKPRIQGVTSSKADQIHPKPSKSEEEERQRPFISSSTATSNQTISQAADILTKKLPGPSKDSPPSAWLKPLQETINEKAAAAAALAARSATTEAASTSAVDVSSTKSTVPTTISSYAWSVVVGSRTTTTTSAPCTAGESVSVPLATKTSEKVAVSKPNQNASMDHADTSTPVTNGSKAQPNVSPVSEPHIRQSTTGETLAQGEGSFESLSEPSRGVSTTVASSTTSTTSLNVCKVRPQKQPTSSVIAISSTTSATVAPSSRSDLTTFSVSTMQSASNNPVLVNPPQYRRPIGDIGDWIGKTSSAIFFDGYTCGGSKKMDNAVEPSLGLNAATAAAAVYMQQQQQQQQQQHQQQQSFRQALPALQNQPMMGFGLHDLTLRHQNGRLNGPCSQNAMAAESYFAASPFSAGSNGHLGSQQPPRGLYPPAPAVQQRGLPSWQPQHHPSQTPEAAFMAVTANGLWSNNYTTPPPTGPHHHPPYLGVIGGDRPSSTSSVSINSRLQPAAAAFASIYGRGGNGSAAPAVGASPYGQPGPPPPSGLYAQSPTQQTPPPHLSFDPNFAYSSGSLSANSSSMFSHQSAGGGPTLLAAPLQQRQPQLHSGSTRSLGDHPQAPPVFINAASHAPYPAPAAVLPQALSTPGLPY